MTVRTAPSSLHRLLIIAIVFALASAWGPIFASAQTTQCSVEQPCVELDPAEEEAEEEEEEEEEAPPAEEEEAPPGEQEEGGLLPDPEEDPVTEPIEEELDPVTEPVEEELDPITEPIEEELETITEPIKDELPDLPVPGKTPDPIEEIEEIKEPIDKKVGETKKSLDETIDNVTQPVEETLDELTGPGSSAPKGPSGGDSPPPSGDESGQSTVLLSKILSHELTAAPTPLTLGPDDGQLTAAAENSSPGVADRITEVITEAAKKLAFPLALALIVGGFLLVQNRLDRRDPKLAEAPRDPEDQLLGFE